MRKTHNEQFAELQEMYLSEREKGNKTKADKYLSEMYFVTRELQTNYLNDYCRKHGIHFDKDVFDDKVEDATIYVIDKFLKNPNFKIAKLSAYGYFGCVKALFKDKDKEMVTESLERRIEIYGEEYLESAIMLSTEL